VGRAVIVGAEDTDELAEGTLLGATNLFFPFPFFPLLFFFFFFFLHSSISSILFDFFPPFPFPDFEKDLLLLLLLLSDCDNDSLSELPLSEQRRLGLRFTLLDFV